MHEERRARKLRRDARDDDARDDKKLHVADGGSRAQATHQQPEGAAEPCRARHGSAADEHPLGRVRLADVHRRAAGGIRCGIPRALRGHLTHITVVQKGQKHEAEGHQDHREPLEIVLGLDGGAPNEGRQAGRDPEDDHQTVREQEPLLLVPSRPPETCSDAQKALWAALVLGEGRCHCRAHHGMHREDGLIRDRECVRIEEAGAQRRRPPRVEEEGCTARETDRQEEQAEEH